MYFAGIGTCVICLNNYLFYSVINLEVFPIGNRCLVAMIGGLGDVYHIATDMFSQINTRISLKQQTGVCLFVYVSVLYII